jgi:acyl-CoA synthetase (AMP-forming)/AMP-acid ligase II
MLLIDYFEQTARTSPAHPFLHFVDEDEGADVLMSYGQADRHSSAVARDLLSRGVNRGTIVPLLVANSPEWIILYLACQKLGAICVGLHTNATAQELEQLLSSIKAQELWYGSEFQSLANDVKRRLPGLLTHTVSPFTGRHLTTNDDALAGLSVSSVPRLTVDDYLSAIFTSGTSGAAPKAALQKHGPVVHAIKRYIDRLRMGPSDRVMLVTPLCHSAALNWGVSLVLMAGATLVLARRFSATRFFAQAARSHPTAIWTMGTVLFILLSQQRTEEEAKTLTQVRFVFGAGSAPRWRQLVERWQCPVLDGYGMTETFGTLTEDDCNGLDTAHACIGRPLQGIELRIVDPQTHDETPTGKVGEIVTRFGQGFAGYLHNDAAFKEAVRDGWFHTGDLAYRDDEGRFFFVDRLKSVIRRGGENISSIEVEECLAAHPDVREAIVLSQPDPLLGEIVVAALVAKVLGRVFSLEEIQAFCGGKLSRFKWPEQIRTISDDSIPRTGAGKIKKVALARSLFSEN